MTLFVHIIPTKCRKLTHVIIVYFKKGTRVTIAFIHQFWDPTFIIERKAQLLNSKF